MRYVYGKFRIIELEMSKLENLLEMRKEVRELYLYNL